MPPNYQLSKSFKIYKQTKQNKNQKFVTKICRCTSYAKSLLSDLYLIVILKVVIVFTLVLSPKCQLPKSKLWSSFLSLRAISVIEVVFGHFCLLSFFSTCRLFEYVDCVANENHHRYHPSLYQEISFVLHHLCMIYYAVLQRNLANDLDFYVMHLGLAFFFFFFFFFFAILKEQLSTSLATENFKFNLYFQITTKSLL